MTSNGTAPRPLKILMLHGYTQSGALFRSKTRALEKNLQKAFAQGVELDYPTAPLRLSPADLPDGPPPSASDDDAPQAFAWWRRRDGPVAVAPEHAAYDGLEAGLAAVARALRERGPFDGVVGFSQGGALAVLVASLLEPGRAAAFAERRRAAAAAAAAATAEAERGAEEADSPIAFPESFLAEGDRPIHPLLRFAVSYSGFASLNPAYAAFYSPPISTPTLHFLGSLDAVVAERRSLMLVDACAGPRVVYHPGGHFLPASQREFVAALVVFIREAMERKLGVAAAVGGEEKAEDMELPF